jgi:polysaccharide export outer membrane protein
MKKMAFFFRLLLLLTLFSACSTKELRVAQHQIGSEVPDPTKPAGESYVIGPGDELEVVVWREKDIGGSVTVRPDGFITLPLVNEVQVVGLTTSRLREVLEQKYREFITDAFVSVRVGKIASTEIFLVGEVSKPGAYVVTGKDTFLQLLTRAGGLTPFADRDDIRIVRREGEKVTEYIVDYNAILEGDLKQDILLKPGDRIIVP